MVKLYNVENSPKESTVIVYVDDLLVYCKDESTIDGIVEAVNDKYHNVQEHTGMKHSPQEMSLDISVTGKCSYHYAYVHR